MHYFDVEYLELHDIPFVIVPNDWPDLSTLLEDHDPFYVCEAIEIDGEEVKTFADFFNLDYNSIDDGKYRQKLENSSFTIWKRRGQLNVKNVSVKEDEYGKINVKIVMNDDREKIFTYNGAYSIWWKEEDYDKLFSDEMLKKVVD